MYILCIVYNFVQDVYTTTCECTMHMKEYVLQAK
jgi:hypothetical protein